MISFGPRNHAWNPFVAIYDEHPWKLNDALVEVGNESGTGKSDYVRVTGAFSRANDHENLRYQNGHESDPDGEVVNVYDRYRTLSLNWSHLRRNRYLKKRILQQRVAP